MLSMISLLLYCLREVLIAFSDFSYTFMNDFCVCPYTFMNDFCGFAYTFMNDFVSINYHSVVSFFCFK